MIKLLPETADELTVVSTPVPEEIFGNHEFINFSEEMFKTMRSSNGIGLACPQIGDNVGMFIMQIAGKKYVCINPSVVQKSETISSYKEGCLSFPGLELMLNRPEYIVAEYYDLDGNHITAEMNGLVARCYQHELDHLDGIVFTCYAGEVKLKLARSKVKKNLKRKRR
jgi:peptide deformylase